MKRLLKKVRNAVEEGGVGLLLERAVNRVRWSWPFYRQSYLWSVTHEIRGAAPTVRVLDNPTRAVTRTDVDAAERILAAFRRAQRDERQSGEKDLWSGISETAHADFRAVSGDAEAAARYLNNVNQRGLGFGIADCTATQYEEMSGSRRLRNEFGVTIKDALVSFAEAVGAVPLNTTENLYLDEDEVLEEIERKMGRLEPSDAEGVSYKAEIGGRLWGARDFWSACIASKVVGKGRVAEIGAGMGKVAWYASQLGVTDYSIYDLPAVNVVQAWTLIRRGVEVNLYGEDGRGVNILPYWKFAESGFDLTLNVDSFPEMSEATVADYLETIKKNSKALLSINRENGGAVRGHTHNIVGEVASRVGGLARASRSPFWIIDDYVEELYTPS